ncbi:MAG: hypothetical protein SangKO_053460 [Sandaracinaceae bacterium]
MTKPRNGALVALGILCAASVFFAAGCATRARVRYATYVEAAPPAPQVEYTSPVPGPGYVWVNGYWYWNGYEYTWVRGHWAVAPGAGYVWVRSGYVHVDGDYRFVPGRWSIEARAPRVQYVHPAPRVRAAPAYRAAPPVRATPPQGRGGGVTVRPR